MSTWRRRRSDRGSITLLFAIVAILIFGATAFAVDLATHGQQRQQLWNTTDAAALAGVSALPGDFSRARMRALEVALENDPSLDPADLVVSYLCLVGDRDGDGQPDSEDIPDACDPGADITISAPPFVCEGAECTAPCVPADDDLCNTIVVSGKKVVDYSFAPVIGIDEGDTSVISAACTGLCGKSPTVPIDLTMIIDRTGSMSAADLANVKNAVLSVLAILDPSKHHVSLGVLGAAPAWDKCRDRSPVSGGATWVVVGLTSDYQDRPDLDVTGDGIPDLNSRSELVRITRCFVTSSQGTNLGSPLYDGAFGLPSASDTLAGSGRAGVKKAVLLMTDGEANQPTSHTSNMCRYAFDMATITKALGIEVFTVGFGVEGPGTDCSDSGGAYRNVPVTRLLANMATQPTTDNCGAGENTDGDHFFCQPKGSDLTDSFVAVTKALGGGSKLVSLPPGT